MEIFQLLGLPADATLERIRGAYKRALCVCHPSNRETGNAGQFIRLQAAYRRYVLGEEAENCLYVCTAESSPPVCRCGALFAIQPAATGRVDCECCSCFVFVEEAAKALPG